ncbi:MAG: DUF805 domain-containing protein [Candidatus Taylorbacteria bacterium]|nr:DUF805 domain-containing protein [Candidatus Taylorbacteria bacterium]
MTYLINLYKGRINQKQYFLSLLLLLIIGCLFEAVITGTLDGNQMRDIAINLMKSNSLLSYFLYILGTLLIFYSASLTVRRLHDTGHSGWWVFLGQITMLVLFFIPSQKENNKYGNFPTQKKIFKGVILNVKEDNIL